MPLNLIVASGAREGEVIPIRKFPFLVGRDKGCHLHAPNEFVSRRHCQIALHDDKLHLVDLDSTNGTFLNGQAVRHEQELNAGDRILVGPLEFVVDLQTDTGVHELKPESEKKAPPQPEKKAPPEPEKLPPSEGINEEAIGDFLLAHDAEDDERSGEDTTEKSPHPSPGQ